MKPDEGSLVEMGTGYTFFWSGLPKVAYRIHNVGFAVRTAILPSSKKSPIAIDERLVTLRLPLILDCWSAKCLPQQWKNANIFLVYKQTGDRAECGNSRCISLLSVAGKVLAKIMLTHLLEHVVDLVLPESRCGFRRGRSTIDMIFVARQLHEESREQHQDLYMAFVDLLKAFDTVNQNLLWNNLRKFGCPPTFIAMLQQFHTGMCAQVVMAGSQ